MLPSSTSKKTDRRLHPGGIESIPFTPAGAAPQWVWAGPFTTVTVSAGQRITGSGASAAVEIISPSGTIRVRRSVVPDSAGPGGVVLLRNLGGTIHFNGNTVAFNDDAGAAGGPAGVQATMVGSGVTWLSSNILWGNGLTGASDLFAGPSAMLFLNANVVGTLAGDLDDVVQQNTQTGNPGFLSSTDLRLTAGSIARNSGNPVAVGGYPTQDVFGDPRVQGTRVDRGAREFPELFASGIE